MQRSIAIEAISTGHPDFLRREFVTLVNVSSDIICLNDWRVVWEDASTGRELHFHRFQGWGDSRPFKPGRKLFLISGLGNNIFFDTGENTVCPIAHWQVFTKSRKHICSVPHIKVSLVDPLGVEIDHLYAHQYRQKPKEQPAIVIGHGRNPAWKDLKDYLHEQLGFEVEAFETEPRAGQTIPQVIDNLGASSNMAILILTGEDLVLAENGKGVEEKLQPRQNVIQELGKFQERFGSSKTLILVENGAIVPSNNSGIVQLRFEPGQIKSTFGDVVAVIHREFSLW